MKEEGGDHEEGGGETPSVVERVYLEPLTGTWEYGNWGAGAPEVEGGILSEASSTEEDKGEAASSPLSALYLWRGGRTAQPQQ